MKRQSKFAMILLSGALSACSTAEPPRTANSACLALRTIGYAQLMPGQTDDPGNQADSDETVAAIADHNARWRGLCPPSDQPRR